jgi:non-specific serine/threonine protein kinase
MNRLEAEHQNLRSALEWASSCGHTDEALRLAGALWRFWKYHGHFSQGHMWLERTLRAGGSTSAAARARALAGLGMLERLLAEYTPARYHLEQSIALYQELGDQEGLALALHGLGEVLGDTGQLAEARSALERSLVISRELGAKATAVGTISCLGEVARAQGDYAQAEGYYCQAYPLSRELRDDLRSGVILHNLGQAARRTGDYRQARQRFMDAFSLSLKMSDPWATAHDLTGLAEVAGDTGDLERAAKLFGAAEMILGSISSHLDFADRIEYERSLALVRGRLDDGTFKSAWAARRAMTMREAAAYAVAEQPASQPGESPPADAPPAETSPAEIPAATPLQATRSKFGGLTAREREVAALVAQGKTNREIAAALTLSERTVEVHVSNILGKLSFSSRAQIAAWAVDQGLIKPLAN